MKGTITERVQDEADRLSAAGRLEEEKQFLQHGTTTVYSHSFHVAEVSLKIAARLRLRVSEQDMIRGALLHDYFLYDWHEPGDGTHRLHGFRHAGRAAENAARDYTLTEKEKRIICSHMFPLDPTHVPDSFESWIVTLADKYCAAAEILRRK